MDIPAYLRRLNYTGSLEPTLDTLRALHLAHLYCVPFENLDIHLGRPIVLEEEKFFAKIVGERRGGFCYELNGLFAALLRELGFQVTLLSARVPKEQGVPGPEFDHLTLRVDLDAPWMADVGYGESFLEPLPLLPNAEQMQGGTLYCVSLDGDRWMVLRRHDNFEWKEQYDFSLIPRQLSEFAEMCHYHQTSPLSHFTRNRVCTLATPLGRITVSGNRLIVTENGARQEHALANDEEWRAALRQHFAIELPTAD